MSDLMFYGVLRMPYEMAMSDELSRRQFWSRAQEAADRVEAAEAELARRAAQPADVEAGELPDLPTLPQSMMNAISDYGMARTDGKTDVERVELWKDLISAIKHYAAEYARADLAHQAAPAQPATDFRALVQSIIEDGYLSETNMHRGRLALDGAAPAQPSAAPSALVQTLNKPSRIDAYVRQLAMSLWRTHYRETSPKFELLDDTHGVLTQIDNMITGLVLAAPTSDQQAGARSGTNLDGSTYTIISEYENDLENDMAAIRDLFPTPDFGELHDLWSEACSEPRAVVSYVKAQFSAIAAHAAIEQAGAQPVALNWVSDAIRDVAELPDQESPQDAHGWLVAELVRAADAVVERWHSRDWKQPHTHDFIYRLAGAVGALKRAAPPLSSEPQERA